MWLIVVEAMGEKYDGGMITRPTRQLWIAQAYSQDSRHIPLWKVELLRVDLCQRIMNVARLNILIERGSYLREGQ